LRLIIHRDQRIITSYILVEHQLRLEFPSVLFNSV